MEYNTKYNRILVFLFIVSCVILGFIIFLTYVYNSNIYTVVYSSYSPSITGWIKSTSLPQNIQNATSITYNGYIYEIGGTGGNGDITGPNLSTVYYAPINSNGTIGSWNLTTALPSLYGSVTEYNGYSLKRPNNLAKTVAIINTIAAEIIVFCLPAKKALPFFPKLKSLFNICINYHNGILKSIPLIFWNIKY